MIIMMYHNRKTYNNHNNNNDIMAVTQSNDTQIILLVLSHSAQSVQSDRRQSVGLSLGQPRVSRMLPAQPSVPSPSLPCLTSRVRNII